MKYILILLITAIVVWPVYWMVQGSFQDHWGVFTVPSIFIPRGLHLKNYEGILSSGHTLRWAWNTVKVIVLHGTLVLSLVAPAGMAFALYEFKGKKIIFWAFLSTIMIPGNTILIGKFIVTRALGLNNSLWAAVVPVCFYAVGIFLFRTFVEEIPGEIIDSARVDGAGEIRILSKIISPLCVPAAGVVLLFTTLGTLNNYLWQGIVLQRIEIKTLLVGMIVQMSNLSLLLDPEMDPLGMRLAAGCILLVPSLLLFVFFNKRFIKQLRFGGLVK